MKQVYGQHIPASRPTPLAAALVAIVLAIPAGGLLALLDGLLF